MNKRGQIADYATYIVMLVVIAVVFLITWYVIGTLNTSWAADTNIPANIVAQNNAVFGNFGSVLDNSFLLMFIGILIGGLILSYVLQSNPGMFFVLLLIVFLLSLVAGYLGNAYTSIAATQLSGAGASMTIMAFIMDHYLLMTFVNITLMTIVFFAKPNSGGTL